jgi:hypothetical protein
MKSKYIIILILAMAFCFRLYFVLVHSNFMHGDESVHGLMAKHIITRGNLPIFSYGENLTGMLNLYPVLLSYAIFGISNISFKLVPITISLVFVFLIFLFGKKISNYRTGLVAMLFAAFCPPFLNMWNVNACSEYIITITLGTLILILGSDIVFDKRLKPNIAYFLLGLTGGIGFWTDPLIISYILTVFLVIFITDKGIFFKRVFVFFIFGFLIGNAPMIIFNCSYTIRLVGGLDEAKNWVSYTTIFEEANTPIFSILISLPGKLWEIITVSIPIMVGGSVWELEKTVIRRAISVVLMTAFWLSVISIFYKRIRDFVLNRKELKRIDLLIIHFLLTIMIFSLSRFGHLTKEPRYLLPLFTAMPIFQSIFLCEIKFKNNIIFTGIIALLLLLNIYGNIFFSRSVDPDHSLWPYDKKLIEYLVENKIETPAADDWLAYQITFATNEKIIGIPFKLYRFSIYKERFYSFDNISYYIFPKVTLSDPVFKYFSYGLGNPLWNDKEFANVLKSRGILKFTTHEFEHYTLFKVKNFLLSKELIGPGWKKNEN